MKWCCSTFKGWYDAAGEKGVAILAGRNSSGQSEFLIQHRAIEPELESSIQSENPVSVVSEIGILFCPWCGRDLNKIYGKHVDALHRPYLKISVPEASV
jgi:hypothetical protein